MDLNNQSAAAPNTNTDSATDNFGAPVDPNESSMDMSAINDAIAATSDNAASVQNTFNVSDISLDDVPSSQDELDRRMKENPGMNLAGGPASPVDVTTNTSIAAPVAAESTPEAARAAAPSAAFVSGDIIDESAAAPADSQPAKTYDNINSDPLANFDSAPANTGAVQPQPEAAAPTAAPVTAPQESPAPAPAPAPAADTITAPARKSKLPIIIGVVLVVAAIAAGVVIFFVTKK